MNIHEKYMKRCIQIAEFGQGNTFPNPSVGCCIVMNGKILAEGFSSKAGCNHAEINAINLIKEKSILSKCTIYITLEPCSHYGKTPPCVDTIIKYKFKKVVIGIKDPNDLVNGKGIKKLQKAGVNVMTGILKKECTDLHKRFLTHQLKKRPYIILKWAQSSNGYISPKERKDKEPFWISNEKSRIISHKWRANEHAILIGAQTLRDDNPKLTTRIWIGNNCKAYILSKNWRKKENKKFNSDSSFEILDKSIINFDNNVAKQICNVLYENEIQSLIVEGGTKTINNFLDSKIWDEIRIFKSDKKLVGGVKAPKIKYKRKVKIQIENDKLEIYKNSDETLL